MFEERYRSGWLNSRREKAEAACEVVHSLMDMGMTREEAIEAGVHEFKHAKAHQGKGYMVTGENAIFWRAAYAFPGKPPRGERKRIAQAVGKENMSPDDFWFSVLP